MQSTDRLSEWFLFFSDIGASDPHSYARTALDRGYSTPPKLSEFAQNIRSELVGAEGLTDFFERHGKKSDESIGGWIGFARNVVGRYRAIAKMLRRQS